jgi:hypothetical protein
VDVVCILLGTKIGREKSCSAYLACLS